MEYRKYDDLVVGEAVLSASLTITEHHIVAFSGLTGDFHPMHMDASYAGQTRFGGRIAHGMLIMSVCTGLLNQVDRFEAVAFLGLEWNMLKAIVVGDTIHARSTLISKEITPSGRHSVVSYGRQIVNQENEVVQDGVMRFLVEV